MTKIDVRRALISVYDKTGLEDLARGLHEAGVEIVSTGSTAARIRDLGIPVTAVDEVTGFPEILGGRVKTLHPHVHAGLLADQNDPDHVATIEQLGIAPFQLLVSNLYPFTDTVAVRRVRARGRRADRHRRAGDGARLGQEPRIDRRRHRTGAVRGTRWMPFVPGDSTSPSGRRWRSRRSATRRATTSRWRPGWAASSRRTTSWTGSRPVSRAGSRRRTSARRVLRYGENPHQRAALYVSHDGGRPASRRRNSCTARR